MPFYDRFTDAWFNLRGVRADAVLHGYAVNLWRRFLRRSGCCGRYGDPGC